MQGNPSGASGREPLFSGRRNTVGLGPCPSFLFVTDVVLLLVSRAKWEMKCGIHACMATTCASCSSTWGFHVTLSAFPLPRQSLKFDGPAYSSKSTIRDSSEPPNFCAPAPPLYLFIYKFGLHFLHRKCQLFFFLHPSMKALV